MKKAFLFIMMIFSVASCVRVDIEDVLLMRDDISLTVKGIEEFSYNPLTCQAAHNPTINEYRVFDDKLSEWFTVRCSERPDNTGQEITADIIWTASNSTRSMNGLEFKVEKIDWDGKVWMWCKKKKVGIVIKNL